MFKRTITAFLISASVLTVSALWARAESPSRVAATDAIPRPGKPVVQVALLLDTSGSMEGLIAQAKTQLWKIVNELALARKDGVAPDIQVSLYQYGNDGLPSSESWIQQCVPLSTDLDKVSQVLFALRTNGGTETCGAVIKHAVEQLQWSAGPKDYRAIFVAGNEPFTQGSVPYKDACRQAIARGIVVNTIFCGPAEEGIRTYWRDGAMLADGSYMNIDKDAAVVHIAAPQDKELADLGVKLNDTYIAYGAEGRAKAANQAAQDSNARASGSLAARSVAKSSSAYRADDWDVVDAVKQGRKLEEMKNEELPEAMRKMSLDARKEYVASKAKERATVQDRIKALNAERERYVAAEMTKRTGKGSSTLDQAVVTVVRSQLQRNEFKVESPTEAPTR